MIHVTIPTPALSARFSRRTSCEDQAVRDEADRLMDDLCGGRPDSALVEDACAELVRLLEIADETVRSDLINDTSLEALLRGVCERRASEALERGDLSQRVGEMMRDG